MSLKTTSSKIGHLFFFIYYKFEKKKQSTNCQS
jgi:hypothetical protein